MALKSTDSQLTALVLWTPHLRAAPLRLTPIGRSWRASHKKPIYAPPMPRCLQLILIFLCRSLMTTHQRFGLLAAALKLHRAEAVRQLMQRKFHLNLRWKTYLTSLPSTARRMYWRHILRRFHQAEELRSWIARCRVKKLMKVTFPTSLRKTAHRKFGESNDVT